MGDFPIEIRAGQLRDNGLGPPPPLGVAQTIATSRIAAANAVILDFTHCGFLCDGDQRDHAQAEKACG